MDFGLAGKVAVVKQQVKGLGEPVQPLWPQRGHRS